MPEKIIDKTQYEQGRTGCTPVERVRPSFFYVERRKLCQQPGDDTFARELFVKILDIEDKGGYAEVFLQELGSDGRELYSASKRVNMAEDGAIIKPGWDPDPELGYLVGGLEPSNDGLNRTRDELLVPVARVIPAVQSSQIEYAIGGR